MNKKKFGKWLGRFLIVIGFGYLYWNAFKLKSFIFTMFVVGITLVFIGGRITWSARKKEPNRRDSE